jgi:cell division protein FtsQ
VTEQPPGNETGAGPATAGPSRAATAAVTAETSASGASPSTGGARVPPRRRRSRWRTAFFGLAGLAIIVAAAWALLGDRVFVVRSVSVTGTHLVTPAEVIAAAGVPLGTPLLRVNAGAVTQRVESIRQVASATVAEDWPDHLTIAVTERVPVLAVRMAAGGYDQVDPTGVIVRSTKARPAALPLLTLASTGTVPTGTGPTGTGPTGTGPTGTALRGNPTVAAAAAVLAELQPSLRRQVAGVSTTEIVTGAGQGAGSQQVTLRLRDGVTVVWGGTDNAAAKNREVALLLLGHVHYVDVSAPGTAVTK